MQNCLVANDCFRLIVYDLFYNKPKSKIIKGKIIAFFSKQKQIKKFPWWITVMVLHENIILSRYLYSMKRTPFIMLLVCLTCRDLNSNIFDKKLCLSLIFLVQLLRQLYEWRPRWKMERWTPLLIGLSLLLTTDLVMNGMSLSCSNITEKT